jgi:hypothetical protein
MDENFDASQLKAASFAGQMAEDNSDGAVELDVYPSITVLPEDM